MPTSHYFPQRYKGFSGEQNLYQDLVDEQIKLFGTDIYYIPRIVLQDSTLDEVRYSKFEEQFQVEMLLQNVNGFGDNSEFISKFGLRITDEVIFRVSTRRWEESVRDFNPNLVVTSRPNEGDLLYFPLTKDIYEIKYVGKEEPYYQFGKIQFYAITAEIYEVGQDDFDTGVADIDKIEEIFSNSISLNLDEGGSLNFQTGETVTGSSSSSTAEVKSWDTTSRVLQVYNRNGTFVEGESLTGSESGASWTIGTFDTLNNVSSSYDQNRQIENEADDIIDWTEGNPFGEVGNFTGSI
jgi:hypothetical protein